MNTFDTPPTEHRAGWYPHPSDPGRRRYWDGQAWTDRTGPELGEFEERMLALAEATANAAYQTGAAVRAIKAIIVFWMTVGIVGAVVIAMLSSLDR